MIGGAGQVFLVRDRHLKKELALKLLLEPPDREDLERFQRELAVLCEIEHPAIARAHDFGYLEKRPYFTSELVQELVAAVAFLHAGGVLHLDIKPSNVVLRQAPGPSRVVLIDFGLVRRGFTVHPGRRVKGSLP